jgi:hypothetical protein
VIYGLVTRRKEREREEYDCKKRRQKKKEREKRNKANNPIDNYLYDVEYERREERRKGKWRNKNLYFRSKRNQKKKWWISY